MGRISGHSSPVSIEELLLFEEGAIQVEPRFSVLAENIGETQGIARNSADQARLDQFAHARRPSTIPPRIFIGKRIELLAVLFHFEQP